MGLFRLATEVDQPPRLAEHAVPLATARFAYPRAPPPNPPRGLGGGATCCCCCWWCVVCVASSRSSKDESAYVIARTLGVVAARS